MRPTLKLNRYLEKEHGWLPSDVIKAAKRIPIMMGRNIQLFLLQNAVIFNAPINVMHHHPPPGLMKGHSGPCYHISTAGATFAIKSLINFVYYRLSP